jgi:dolichol-phosphate mannosyltransferase
VPTERVTVVIPTYNERENLAHIVAAVTHQGFRVLVVDDSSPDGTADLARRISATDSRVSVLQRHAKEGLGPAYAAGFDRAIADGAEIIVEMDADFSHDPTDLPRLIEAIDNGADIAIGSRYVPGGSTPDWPLHRQMISRGGNIYVRLMLGLPVRDATAGFRAFRVPALQILPYATAEASGYGFQVEMAWRASQAGLNIVEVPIAFRDRAHGTSKMGPDIVREAMTLVTRWGYARWKGRLAFWRR